MKEGGGERGIKEEINEGGGERRVAMSFLTCSMPAGREPLALFSVGNL